MVPPAIPADDLVRQVVRTTADIVYKVTLIKFLTSDECVFWCVHVVVPLYLFFLK